MGDIEDIKFEKSTTASSKSVADTASTENNEVICGSKRLREHSDAPIKVWMKTFGCQHNFSDSEYMVLFLFIFISFVVVIVVTAAVAVFLSFF